MRRLGVLKWVLAGACLGAVMGAAPAAPSFYTVERSIASIRGAWGKPGAAPQPNAPGWNAFFDALLAEFRTYHAATGENDRLASLNRLYQMSVAMAGTNWRSAALMREE